MAFIDDRFLLENDTAVGLYQAYAAPQPIFDYHCHLSPRQIAENRRFSNLFEVWLEGDHYKWRAMRVNGEPEQFCTGNVAPYEKFLAWARTVPYTLRNPLYHWTHLELQRYFGITELLDEASAPRIWDQANSILQSGLDVHEILRKFQVHTIGTTDDPADSLEYHAQIAASTLPTRVVPTLPPRPSAARRFSARLSALDQSAGASRQFAYRLLPILSRRTGATRRRLSCRRMPSLRSRLDICYADPCTGKQAAAIFDDALTGVPTAASQQHKFASYVMHFLGQLYARHEWTMQLHLGALRNVNSRAKSILGPDTGFDAMGGAAQLAALAKFLDRLEQDNTLPRTILYNSNPVENYAFATLAGAFSAENLPGKVQFGSGWWFLDQKEGIEWQLNAPLQRQLAFALCRYGH